MTYDFIIIGGGIAGASIAYELARDAKVCLIEAEAQPGVHATGRSAALFVPNYGGREIRALTRASRAFFNRPTEGFCEGALLRPRRCLYIAHADQVTRLHQLADGVRGSGGRAVRVDEAEATALVPLLRRGYVAEAMMDPEAMDIDVDALHQGFLRGARAAGATLVMANRIQAARRIAGCWTLPLREGIARAPILINAAGAWADEVAAIFGADPIGFQALRRTALLVDPPPGVDVRNWPAVIDADGAFYFKPDAGRLLLSPADETPDQPGDAHPDEFDIAVGVDRVQAALDIVVRRVAHSWAGLRTFAPDRVPVVGFDPKVQGFFWCAGQGGFGIQTAPALSRMAAALAMQRSLPADIAEEGLATTDLSPDRFAKADAGCGSCDDPGT